MEKNSEKIKIHNEFVAFMHKNGIHKPKKHGEWIYKKLYSDLFVEMDSWNQYIKIKRGSGEYNYWTGFEGERVDFCGGNFGGYYFNNVDISMLKYWFVNAKINFRNV